MADLQTQARRLAILQLLAQDPDYSINDALLKELLRTLGHGVALHVVKADLAWLESVGLLATTDLTPCLVAVLKSEGLDVSRGESLMPGVARPRPE
jgi:hypothetical protein